jgi:thioester reductase-like protein
MHTLVAALLHVGAIPDIELLIDMSPVDFVAGAIVEISRKRACLGGTYHLMNHEPLRVATMGEWLRQMGQPVETTTLREWRRGLASLVQSIPAELMGLMAEILTEGSADDLGHDAVPAAFQLTFDTRRCREALQGTGVSCHPVDARLLAVYRDYLQEVGFFQLIQAGEPPALVGTP